MDVNQLQPLDHIGCGAETSGNNESCFGTRNEHGHGELPPISTFLKQLQQHPHTSVKHGESEHTGDWSRSETVLSDPQQRGGGDAENLLQVSEGQNFQQAFTGREQQSKDPNSTQTSAKPGSWGNSVTSSDNQPEEKDQFLLKFWQDKSGHIKRPMNAFLLWSKIHRRALKEQNPGARLADISIHQGHEWSKLSEEERQPYFEMARNLKQIHEQTFPDYEYRPLRKKSKQLFPPRLRGTQGTTISASRPVPSQSEFQGPGMNAWPAMMPYTAGYYSCPFFYQYIPVDPYSSGNIQSASTLKNEADDHNSHPQMVESNMASPYYRTKQQEHCMVYNHHEYMTGSISTTDSLEPTDVCTNQQLLTNNTVDYNCDDYVDVVGLL